MYFVTEIQHCLSPLAVITNVKILNVKFTLKHLRKKHFNIKHKGLSQLRRIFENKYYEKEISSGINWNQNCKSNIEILLYAGNEQKVKCLRGPWFVTSK